MSAIAQASLFDAAPAPSRIAGLTYVANSVTRADERSLAAFIATLDFKPFEWRGFKGNRRTISFGYRYDFNGGGFQVADAIPDALRRARSLVCASLGEEAAAFEQCSVIEYAPSAGIGWHKDRAHFERIAGLSLLAPCRFRFRREREGGGWERDGVLLEPRSAYLLTGEARHIWRHSIAPVTALRHSITFRTLTR